MYSLEKAVQRCYDRCNLDGESVDVWGKMMQYKAIRELSDDEQERIYFDIVAGLGFADWRMRWD